MLLMSRIGVQKHRRQVFICDLPFERLALDEELKFLSKKPKSLVELCLPSFLRQLLDFAVAFLPALEGGQILLHSGVSHQELPCCLTFEDAQKNDLLDRWVSAF